MAGFGERAISPLVILGICLGKKNPGVCVVCLGETERPNNRRAEIRKKLSF